MRSLCAGDDRQVRDALLALVGIRRALFPDATAYQPASPPPGMTLQAGPPDGRAQHRRRLHPGPAALGPRRLLPQRRPATFPRCHRFLRAGLAPRALRPRHVRHPAQAGLSGWPRGLSVHDEISRRFRRLAVTIAAVVVAIGAGVWLWNYYLHAPWTRDGRVQADIVQVTPDVSGLVASVMVHDNQVVHVGAPLFQIDRARFELALQQKKPSSPRTGGTAGSDAGTEPLPGAQQPERQPGKAAAGRLHPSSNPPRPTSRLRPIAASPNSTSTAHW